MGPCLLIAAGCSERETETLRFAHGATDVEVVFRGEVADDAVFGAQKSLLDHVRPLDAKGRPPGKVTSNRPGWLHFEYQVDGERREVLIAKQPLMHLVSWSDIARAGAALSDGSMPARDGAPAVQGVRVKDVRGNEYRVRLPTCGHSTLADLSEWNLLIGAVHRGDVDFKGAHYGWVKNPYDDEDLKVGYHGSLSWCQDSLKGERVARGYFFVSRLHAAPGDLRTDRLHWRPVLERVATSPRPDLHVSEDLANAPIRWSPSRRVGYAGTVSSAEVFGGGMGIADQLNVDGGMFVGNAQPDWLRFVADGRTLLVAAQPIKRSVSWDAIARAGAVLGDGSDLRVGWRTYSQEAEVKGRDGRRYRVRLLKCGRSTLDLGSEWNQLLGGVHRGDGDFIAHPLGVYGWLAPPLDDQDLGIGLEHGGASWCQELIEVSGKTHGVNRGYLTISRFHATETDYVGSGFGWRPVLESIP